MSENCETVMVEGADGKPLLINKSDYEADFKNFVLLEVEPVVVTAGVADTAPVEPVVVTAGAAPVAMMVSKQGKGTTARYFVVNNPTGDMIVNTQGVDEAGYEDEATAWSAITALSLKA